MLALSAVLTVLHILWRKIKEGKELKIKDMITEQTPSFDGCRCNLSAHVCLIWIKREHMIHATSHTIKKLYVVPVVVLTMRL